MEAAAEDAPKPTASAAATSASAGIDDAEEGEAPGPMEGLQPEPKSEEPEEDEPEEPEPASAVSEGVPGAIAPVPLANLEDRAISASFLKKFTREHVTPELELRATEDAIPWLEGQLAQRWAELQQLQAVEQEMRSGGGKPEQIAKSLADAALRRLVKGDDEDFAKKIEGRAHLMVEKAAEFARQDAETVRARARPNPVFKKKVASC